MNIEYIKNVVAPRRKQEIKEGKNLSTAEPVYVVLDLVERYLTRDEYQEYDDYDPITNEKGKRCEYGFLVGEDDARTFKKKVKSGKGDPVIKIYIDKFVAFFLTSEAAHDYLKYQRHNMNDPYVYVFHCGYRNHEMYQVLKEINL